MERAITDYEKQRRLYVFAGAATAAAFFLNFLVPALLAVLPVFNFLILSFMDRQTGPGRTGNRVTRVFANINLSISIFVHQVIVVLSWFLCLLLVYAGRGAELAGAAGVLLVAWLICRRFFFDGNDALHVAPKHAVIALAASSVLLLALDLIFIFEFLLLMAAAFYAGVLSLLAVRGVLRLKVRRACGMRARAGVWALALVVIAVLFYASTNLSALGKYHVFVRKSWYTLEESRRAGINSLGFRGPEIEVKKPRDQFRIVFMGDSATYGWLLSEDQTFVRLLEKRLNDAARGLRFEVVNAGVPTYNVKKITWLMETRVAALEPDLIVLMTGANDMKHNSPVLFGLQVEQFIDKVRRMRRHAVLCSYPYPESRKRVKNRRIIAYNRELERMARKHKQAFFDVHAAMRGHPELFMLDDHPNAAGNVFLAEAFFKFLAQKNIVPGVDEGRRRRQAQPTLFRCRREPPRQHK